MKISRLNFPEKKNASKKSDLERAGERKQVGQKNLENNLIIKLFRFVFPTSFRHSYGPEFSTPLKNSIYRIFLKSQEM